MHLAELNISKWKVDPQSPEGSGFTDNVARINKLAEGTDGSSMVMTLSTRESAKHLEHFVWNTVHKQIYNGKNQWFDHMESHSFVMWRIEEGHRPSLEEAKERLDFLDTNGDSDRAFGWSHLPHVKLWQTQQCG